MDVCFHYCSSFLVELSELDVSKVWHRGHLGGLGVLANHSYRHSGLGQVFNLSFKLTILDTTLS